MKRVSFGLAIVVLVFVILWAIIPGVFASGDPTMGSQDSLLPPSGEHWFGTDSTGRDLYTRVVYGARQSLVGAILAVAVGAIFGTAIGVFAGSARKLDAVLMRAVDVLLSIPSLLLSLSIIIIVGFGTVNASIAVGFTSVAMFARLARSQVLQVVSSDFVEAAYGSGGTFFTVLWRHVLPNSLAPVFAMAGLQLGSSILQISTLGFLGYGAQPPTPEWGLLVADGRDFVATSWWLTVLPGLMVVAVVLSTHRISDALRKGAER